MYFFYFSNTTPHNFKYFCIKRVKYNQYLLVWILMAWCFSPTASVATVLRMQAFLHSCLCIKTISEQNMDWVITTLYYQHQSQVKLSSWRVKIFTIIWKLCVTCLNILKIDVKTGAMKSLGRTLLTPCSPLPEASLVYVSPPQQQASLIPNNGILTLKPS